MLVHLRVGINYRMQRIFEPQRSRRKLEELNDEELNECCPSVYMRV
jgi:uncharacterized protein YjiS (DUF1127 family)